MNLQDANEFASNQLNRDTWKDAAVRSLVEATCLLWQSPRRSADAQQVAALYNVGAYPFVGVVDPRTGQLVVSWTGFVAPERLTDRRVSFFLAIFVDNNKSFL